MKNYILRSKVITVGHFNIKVADIKGLHSFDIRTVFKDLSGTVYRVDLCNFYEDEIPKLLEKLESGEVAEIKFNIHFFEQNEEEYLYEGHQTIYDFVTDDEDGELTIEDLAEFDCNYIYNFTITK